jgi:hypothetical protein
MEKVVKLARVFGELMGEREIDFARWAAPRVRGS